MVGEVPDTRHKGVMYDLLWDKVLVVPRGPSDTWEWSNLREESYTAVNWPQG